MAVSKPFSPHTLTTLCTYQCTAACRQCCFGSGPKVKGRLGRHTIIARIEEARREFPNLKLVVFSGGEALMLTDDLFASIAHGTSAGLLTRVVSNGYWGKTPGMARNTVAKLQKAGLCELNLSVGRDHQEWIPVSSVINAAVAAADAGVCCSLCFCCSCRNCHYSKISNCCFIFIITFWVDKNPGKKYGACY